MLRCTKTSPASRPVTETGTLESEQPINNY